MSTTPILIAAKTPRGQGTSSKAVSSTRPGTKKQSSTTSKLVVDTSSSDSFVPRIFQRGQDVALSSMNGNIGVDLDLLSHLKELRNTLNTKEDEWARKKQPTKHKTKALPNKGTNKLVKYKETHIVASRRPSSLLDLIGHFFTHFFLIFVIVVGLGSSWWTWKTRPKFSNSTPLLNLEVEKLEEFVSSTNKWMQGQLEAIDIKVGHEVGALKKEVGNKLHLHQTQIAIEVNNLREKVKEVGTTVEVLFNRDSPLTEKEALVLIKKVVDTRAAEGKGKAPSLDDVRTVAKQVVLKELERHSADGIGRVDYALGSGGGRVIAHSKGYYVGKEEYWKNIFAFLPSSNHIHYLADKILQPSFGEPGNCLPLKGSDVWVDIALRTTIHPDAITLEHVIKDNAYDVSSAPRFFRLFGWREARGHGDIVQDLVTPRLFGEFKYEIKKSSVQSFSLNSKDVAGASINMIRVHILSNHGSLTHTCIYRIRLHGLDPTFSLTPSIAERDS